MNPYTRRGPKIVQVPMSIVLWAERMGHHVDDELVSKAMRQYLTTLERNRRNKRRLRRTPEGRARLRAMNAASRKRRREDNRAETEG